MPHNEWYGDDGPEVDYTGPEKFNPDEGYGDTEYLRPEHNRGYGRTSAGEPLKSSGDMFGDKIIEEMQFSSRGKTGANISVNTVNIEVPKGKERQFAAIVNKYHARSRLNATASKIRSSQYFAVLVTDEFVDDLLADVYQKLYN